MSCNRCNILCLGPYQWSDIFYTSSQPTTEQSHVIKPLAKKNFFCRILKYSLSIYLIYPSVHVYSSLQHLSRTNWYIELTFGIYISRAFYFPFDFIFSPIPTRVHGAFRVVAAVPSYRGFSTSLRPPNPIRCPSLLNETFLAHLNLFCWFFLFLVQSLLCCAFVIKVLEYTKKC